MNAALNNLGRDLQTSIASSTEQFWLKAKTLSSASTASSVT